MKEMIRFLFASAFAFASLLPAAELKIATFKIDATPPLGSPLCNGAVKPVKEIVTPLTARGLVLLGAGKPIVLCAFDWVGIGNEGHDAFRAALADAVGTSADRVTVHTLHQHDAPGSDFATERLLEEHGLGGAFSNAPFDREVMQRLAAAAKASPDNARVRTAVAMAQVSRGNMAAMADLEALAAGESNSRADLILISARQRQGDFAGAMKAIDVLEKKQPDRAQAHGLRGQLLFSKGDVAGARRSFEIALSKEPSYFAAVAALSGHHPTHIGWRQSYTTRSL